MIDAVRLRQQIHALPWVHTIDLGNGHVTPGAWPPSPLIHKGLEHVEFAGRKVLDVGCWDGLWSFEAERRGAREVFATDDISQRPHREQPTFALAHRVLDSRVKYYPDLSVYRIPELGVRDFDIVLFCGVYYHLKNPLLALARLRQVMRPGAILVVEGEVLHDRTSSYAQYYYRDSYLGDRSTWWVPTIRCLREWVQCSRFEVFQEYNVADDALGADGPPPWRRLLKRLLRCRPRFSRSLLLARAVTGDDGQYPYADEELVGIPVS